MRERYLAILSDHAGVCAEWHSDSLRSILTQLKYWARRYPGKCRDVQTDDADIDTKGLTEDETEALLCASYGTTVDDDALRMAIEIDEARKCAR